jgi:hypothetical protein
VGFKIQLPEECKNKGIVFKRTFMHMWSILKKKMDEMRRIEVTA